MGKSHKRFSYFWFAMVGALCVMTALVFSSLAVQKADKKDFWIDEFLGFDVVRTQKFTDLVFHGARAETSSAPLDYIFIKVLDGARSHGFLNRVPENVYYRLNSIGWMLVSGLFVSFLYVGIFFAQAKDHKVFLAQSCFLLMALAAFYFWPSNFLYSLEMRPYALWNSLWFLLGAWLILDGRLDFRVFVLGVLLALTSGGALFQLGALAVSGFIYGRFQGKGVLSLLKQAMKFFIIPVLLVIYYAGHHVITPLGSDQIMYYGMLFFTFWGSMWKVPLFCGLGLLMALYVSRQQGYFLVFTTILGLYLIAPVLSLYIISRHIIFDGRHYIYFHSVIPFFILALSLALPEWLARWERGDKSEDSVCLESQGRKIR